MKKKQTKKNSTHTKESFLFTAIKIQEVNSFTSNIVFGHLSIFTDFKYRTLRKYAAICGSSLNRFKDLQEIESSSCVDDENIIQV